MENSKSVVKIEFCISSHLKLVVGNSYNWDSKTDWHRSKVWIFSSSFKGWRAIKQKSDWESPKDSLFIFKYEIFPLRSFV